MKHSTHKRIKTVIAREIKQRYRIVEPFRGISYPDTHRGDSHPFHDDIDFKQHHDIPLNSMRIKQLIFYAWAFVRVHKRTNAIFDYCIALHFLCDSVIPDAKHSENKRTTIENMFDDIEINHVWKRDLYKPYTFHDMNCLIDEFMEDCPLIEADKHLVENKMKDLFQTGLKLACFVFEK